jgi:hypothetical protein
LPGKPEPTYFGEKEAHRGSDDIRDADDRRRFLTVTALLEGGARGEPKQRTEFRIPGMTAVHWICANQKAFPLPFYGAFGLMAAPPLGKRCKTCGREHGDTRCQFVTIGKMRKRQWERPDNQFAGCTFPFCGDRGRHANKVCPTLNHRCESCLFRGHKKGKRCGQLPTNLAVFELFADMGFVTSNRMRDWVGRG